MGFLNRLFGGNVGEWTPRPFLKNTTPEHVREWFAHVPPWSKLAPGLQDVLIVRLMGNPMFEVFVHVSMQEKLIEEYRALDRLLPLNLPAAIYAQVAAILCESGLAAERSS